MLEDIKVRSAPTLFSPLLANIALHGMEEALTVYGTLKNGKPYITTEGVKYDYRGQHIGNRAVVRYADDFVCFCESREDAEKSVTLLTEWLKERGLTLSPEKTKIVHLTEGFNFLGFNIRHYEAPQTAKTKWKLLIKPSSESVQKIRNKLREEWQALQGQNVSAAIKRLNPIVRGWANYFRTGVAREVFHSLDRWMFVRATRYVRRTHPKKPRYWRDAKYWGKLNLERSDKWVFGNKHSGMHLLKFSWFSIERHSLVKGNASPDDAHLRAYWTQRNEAKAKDLMPSKQRLARQQKGICPRCGDSLFNGEEIHTHHRIPKSEGGKDSYGNLELVHLFCHQQIHTKKAA